MRIQDLLTILEDDVDTYTRAKSIIGKVSTPPCLSLDNDYVPFHALLDGKIFINHTTDKSCVLYQHTYPKTYNHSRSYERYFDNSLYGNNWFKIQRAGIEGTFLSRRGEICDITVRNEVHQLATLCFDSRYAQHIIPTQPLRLDVNHMVMVVSNDFSKLPKYNNLFKAFKKYVLDDLGREMNILYTPSIKNLVYKPLDMAPPKPRNIIEMKSGLKQFSKDLLTSLQYES